MKQRELLERQPAQPSDKYGKSPDKRSLSELLDFGFVLIDKPSGPTSHQVSAYVQKILGIKKSGHAGTLDPKVTGVLPIATARASRLLEFLLQAGKTYVCVMHLHADVPRDKIDKAVEHFTGTITQLPPKRSAVARRNRQRTIYSFDVHEISGRDILFTCDVQAGTYIRKLCHDFGKFLGVGAHMAELRRTRSSFFKEDLAVSLQSLADAHTLAVGGNESAFRKIFYPAEMMAEYMPKVVVLDSAIHSVTHGASLKIPGVAALESKIKPGDTVRLVSAHGELIAVGLARMSSKQMMAKQEGVAVKPKKVFLSEDVYPRME